MIRKFINKVALLSVIVLAVLCVFKYIYDKRIKKIKIDSKITTVICGDSHVQCAVDDSILNHSLNVANSGEPYIYTYNVIKVLKNDHPQINVVILGYSFHSLAKAEDDFIVEDRWTDNAFPRDVPILDKGSLVDILKRNSMGVVKDIPNILQTMFSSLLDDSSFSFMGHHEASRSNKVTDTSIRKEIKAQYLSEANREQEFSQLQEEYLRKIVDYCNKEHIKLILLNAPVTKEYYDEIPVKFIKEYYAIYQELKQNAVLFDLHDLNMPKENFRDASHVNEFGSVIVTSKIDTLLNKQLP